MQENEIKVSVVVPIYNVEHYVGRCLADLSRQTLRDIEIICVDDGSTDGSALLLPAAAAKDARIKIVSQANAGAGAARNTGLAVARGEYVFFCDPDDSCSRHMLKGMYRRAKRTDADIVIAGKCVVDVTSGKILSKYGFHRNIWALKQPFSGKDMADDVFMLVKSVAWDKLFRRKFIIDNGLRFQNTSRSNDVFFVDMALALAKRIALVPRAYYRYSIDRVGSLQSGKDNTPLAFLDAYAELEKGLRKNGLFGQFAKSYVRVLWRKALFNMRMYQNHDNAVLCYEKTREVLLRLKSEVDLSGDKILPMRAVALYRMMLANASPDDILSALHSKSGLEAADLGYTYRAISDNRRKVRRFIRCFVPVPLREFVKFVRVRLFGNRFHAQKNGKR